MYSGLDIGTVNTGAAEFTKSSKVSRGAMLRQQAIAAIEEENDDDDEIEEVDNQTPDRNAVENEMMKTLNGSFKPQSVPRARTSHAALVETLKEKEENRKIEREKREAYLQQKLALKREEIVMRRKNAEQKISKTISIRAATEELDSEPFPLLLTLENATIEELVKNISEHIGVSEETLISGIVLQNQGETKMVISAAQQLESVGETTAIASVITKKNRHYILIKSVEETELSQNNS